MDDKTHLNIHLSYYRLMDYHNCSMGTNSFVLMGNNGSYCGDRMNDHAQLPGQQSDGSKLHNIHLTFAKRFKY